MKIIKFHLPTHFANDILRFGSMKNFDTGIGESHHKTEAKHPAKNTERRKSNFEYQTAKRQVENLAINIAYEDTVFKNDSDARNDRDEDYVESKWFRYCWFDDRQTLIKNNSKEICQWKDKVFQNQLSNICKALIQQGCVEGPLQFFTQHNRGQFIFRADPSYESNDPWYDWASIKWEQEGVIPAKLLLFWHIQEDQFKHKFNIGSTTVTCAGSYAISYSLLSKTSAIKKHRASELVKYAKIDFDRDLCIFPVESIHSPITALPYKIEDDIVSAEEWIFLIYKSNWKKIFFDFMKTKIASGDSSTKNNKRKDAPL
jgi:hypothetical protein